MNPLLRWRTGHGPGELRARELRGARRCQVGLGRVGRTGCHCCFPECLVLITHPTAKLERLVSCCLIRQQQDLLELRIHQSVRGEPPVIEAEQQAVLPIGAFAEHQYGRLEL